MTTRKELVEALRQRHGLDMFGVVNKRCAKQRAGRSCAYPGLGMSLKNLLVRLTFHRLAAHHAGINREAGEYADLPTGSAP